MSEVRHRAAWDKFFARAERDGKLQPANPRERFQALGRLKYGEMNKTEAAYAQELQLRKTVNEILEYWFQPFTFRIAKGLSYTPDFVVLYPNGTLQIIDIKPRTTIKKDGLVVGDSAYAEEDSLIRIKVCARLFPFQFLIVFPKRGGGWEEKEF